MTGSSVAQSRSDEVIAGAHARVVVVLWHVDAGLVVQGSDEVDDVHGIEVGFVAAKKSAEQGLGVSGFCSKRSTAARKRPPSWPSDARWSAARVARTTGRTPRVTPSAEPWSCSATNAPHVSGTARRNDFVGSRSWSRVPW